MIAGDGGYDWGQAWRWDGSSYELLGQLPSGNMSTASTINRFGEVVGTSRDAGSFLVPPSAFVAAPGEPNLLVGPGGWGTHGNDAGQVVGYMSNHAYLFTPGSGVLMLGPLGSKTLTWAWSVNDQGVVVGEAASANGNGHVPWIWTAGDGIQEIGAFGGSAIAVDVNDAGQVLGNDSVSGGQPWTWTAEGGLVFLDQLQGIVDGINLGGGIRINDAGQLLMRGNDTVNGGFVPVVLTPIVADPAWIDLGSALAGTHGEPALSGSGPFTAGSSVSLDLSGGLENASAFLVLGVDRVDLPFKGGVLVPAFTPPLGTFLGLPLDGGGGLHVESALPGDLPAGLTLNAQVWIVDGAGPKGLAASNALASP